MGCKYFFYDTLKSDSDSLNDWSSFKKTTTLLAELAKESGVFIYGSLQLLDEIENISALSLNSNHIANAKQIRHVLTSLILIKEIEADEYSKIKYYPSENDGIGEHPPFSLPLPESNNPSDKLYAFITSKNRAGEKKKMLFRVNLDLNQWYCLGYIARK